MAPSAAPSGPTPPRFLALSDTAAAGLLAFVGGAVDALGWYGLFSIFVGSITGNIVIGSASVIPTVTGWAPRLIVTAVFVCGAGAGRIAATLATRGGARALPSRPESG